MKKNNIILIGMPGSGKSTIGVVLAKALGYSFIDSDIVIQEKTGKKLWELIKEKGKEGFNEIEGEINCSINPCNTVIATGGSAIYSSKAMKHFRNIGKVTFLDVDLETIKKRLGDLKARGISMKEGETIDDIYKERLPLYREYAHVEFKVKNETIGESVKELTKQILQLYSN